VTKIHLLYNTTDHPCAHKSPLTESWFLVTTTADLKMPIHEQAYHKVSLLRPKSGSNSEVCYAYSLGDILRFCTYISRLETA